MSNKWTNRPNSRLVAARLLSKLEQGRSLSELFESGLSGLDERDQGFVKELVFGVSRWYFRLEAISQRLVSKPLKPKEREVKALVLLGLYQLLYTRVAPHAAVAETAEVARKLKKKWAVGLINAVLRRFQREQEAVLAAVDQTDAARTSFPRWLLEELQQAWPEQWPAITEASNQRPPMSLRVNQKQSTREQYQALLAENAIECEAVAATANGLVLSVPLNAETLPGFADGAVSVQDCGAQLAAQMMDLAAGQQVLDACAAPGGKSCHILESVDGEINLVAMDVDGGRLERVSQNLQRLNLTAKIVLGDAARPAGAWAGVGSYDRILLDVPCSATGVIRRHPDIKLLRKASDITKLVALQGQILQAIWPLLKPGGMLLYATCSLLPRENELQVAQFLQDQDDAQERPIEQTWGIARPVGRQTLPGEETMDGFYYACLQKI